MGMNPPLLGAGDWVLIDGYPERGAPIRAQLVARDDDLYLVLCDPDELGQFAVSGCDVALRSDDQHGHATTVTVVHSSVDPVGLLLLTGDLLPEHAFDERRANRLHRIIPARVLTGDGGSPIDATIIDLSVGGARLRLRTLPTSLDCTIEVPSVDPPLQVPGTVLDVTPTGIGGQQYELRFAFVDDGPDTADRLRAAVEGGIVDLLRELGLPAVTG